MKSAGWMMRSRRGAIAITAALLLSFVVGGSSPTAGVVRPGLLVGAYYYLWWPLNRTDGTLRAHLIPRQGPDPTQRASSNPATAERDISQAQSAGINFFAVDWWPYRPWDDANLGAFLRARNLSHFKFCMFYETWTLGFNDGNETTPVTPGKELQFDVDMLRFARTVFSNHSYLRINGRPVVVLYLTRTLTGDVAGMIGGARRVLEAHGYDPYFIGDEVYWRVTQENPPSVGSTLTVQPQVARMRLFDAVTAYTLYSEVFTGYPGETAVVAFERRLLQTYCRATNGVVPVLPVVSPGFNDRGTRLLTNHPVQARQWLPGEGPSSTLDQMLRRVAIPSLDPNQPILFVTAWNEWNEDTGVQPIAGTPTKLDDSVTGSLYTQGYTYGGEGDSASQTLHRDIDEAKAHLLTDVSTGRCPN
ncbi:MAG: glycoside hydrolase family 99-like domain-containing protein [Acidimicrobiales bacterium]|nr:glycoside hydrolase family 99-like domain-containing protein [Acidimicrobiales bacterium]